MYQRSGGGGQHFHKRQYDRDKVNTHRQGNAGFDRLDCRVGQPFQIRDLGNVITHEGDFRGVNGNVASHAPHRHADISCFQRRGIVDAIADHADLVMFSLQFLNAPHLFFGQKLRPDFGNANLLCKIIRCFLMVAGKQNGTGVHI